MATLDCCKFGGVSATGHFARPFWVGVGRGLDFEIDENRDCG
jgi:hypothetical protein